MPIRQHAIDHNFERFCGRHKSFDIGIARILHLGKLARCVNFRWWNIKASSPELKFLIPVFSQRLGFVFSLQGAIVALIQTPGSLNGNPQPIRGVQSLVRCLNSPRKQGCVHHIRQKFVLGEKLPCAPCFLMPLLGESNINPAGKQVFLVPFGLTVAKKYQCVSHSPSLLIPSASTVAVIAEHPWSLRHRGAQSPLGWQQ